MSNSSPNAVSFFYFDHTGKKIGVFSPAQIKGLAAKGIIKPDTILENNLGQTATADSFAGLVFGNDKAASSPPKKTTPKEKPQREQKVFCHKCGTALHINADFCSVCNAPVLANQRKTININIRELAKEVLQTAKKVSWGNCFKRGYDLVNADYWRYFIVCMIYWFGCIVLGVLTAGVVGFIFQIIFTGGVHYYFLGRIREQRRKLSDIFIVIALRRMKLHLLLTGLVVFGISYLIGAGIVLLIMSGLGVGLLGIPFLLVLSIYVAIIGHLSYVLVLEKRITFWKAIYLSMRLYNSQFCPITIWGGIWISFYVFTLLVPFFLPQAWATLDYLVDDLFGDLLRKEIIGEDG